jgi:hypothetical protein
MASRTKIVTFACSKCGVTKSEDEFYDLRREHACKECVKARVRKWQQANAPRMREHRKAWKQRNPEQVRTAERARKARDPERERATSRRSYQRNIESRRATNNARQKRYVHRMRQGALDAYGRECACCGDSTEVFLAIDHIDGGGNRHRKEIGGSGSHFYIWLARNDYPPGFQTLCHNCNWAKSRGGCPHNG